MSNGIFEVYQDMHGTYRFRLRAPNHKILAVGKGYATKEECIHGVNAVKRYAAADVRDLTSPGLRSEPSHDLSAAIRARAKTLGVASTTLHLENPTPERPRIAKGTRILFRGRLQSGSEGISEAPIIMCEHDRSFKRDDHIATGITQHDGTFAIPWDARPMDWWDDSVEVYAKYDGSDTYRPTRSQIYSFHIT